mmetsp:Transcript_49429/g.84989  ORF Transcript_49429/g.84989 Transcript_49429/m.84989 type:complete len:119 (-) Transcript_49429:81-437(-)
MKAAQSIPSSNFNNDSLGKSAKEFNQNFFQKLGEMFSLLHHGGPQENDTAQLLMQIHKETPPLQLKKSAPSDADGTQGKKRQLPGATGGLVSNPTNKLVKLGFKKSRKTYESSKTYRR